MNKHISISSSILVLAAVCGYAGAGVALAGDFVPQSTIHPDGRPKQDFITPDAVNKNGVKPAPPATRGAAVSPEAKVLEFLKANAARYGLSDDLADLRLVGKQKSLLGTHYRFQQFHEGKEVIAGEIVVSTDVANEITRVSNNILTAAEANKASDSIPLLDKEKALDAAWQDLKITDHAKVLEEPTAELKFYNKDHRFRLVYDVRIAVSEPRGSWLYLIDARSGEVIDKQNRATDLSNLPEDSPRRETGPLASRDALVQRYRNSARMDMPARTRGPVAPSERADGSALVFDPDPVSTLKDGTLRNNDPPAKFDNAYVKRVLPGLTKRGGTFYLEGPYVRIAEIEDPVEAASTSPDGNWTAKRGDEGFDDVMVYFHIDRAQRYLQSLGFTGVIDRPIDVDANGVQGADNSHHLAGPNGKSGKLVFGHGCVPDIEDADVIMHEYGHAIHAEIAGANWKDGDSRAIGEGFGDYWANSLTHSSGPGAAFEPDRVFRWDGTCWGGRTTNRQGIKYVPGSKYGPHRPIPGNPEALTDELWSSPLVQAMHQLVAAGYPHEDADKIVIQGMFGLATSDFSMNDLAQLTVVAAKALYPQGPHADIFLKQFQAYNICQPGTDQCLPPEQVVSKRDDSGDTANAKTSDAKVDQKPVSP